MRVVLSSFRRWHSAGAVQEAWPARSIAQYQPHWLPQVPVLRALTPVREDGTRLRPRDHAGNLVAYRDELLKLFHARFEEIREAIAGVDQLALLCWCPYAKAAKRQLAEHGTFVCHGAVAGLYLSEVFRVTVQADRDRGQMWVP